jgi:hypothetical protein
MNNGDRLTISFCIWAIFEMKTNPYYDDLERRFIELKEPQTEK